MVTVPESAPDAALSRIREVCYRFSGAEEKLSHGAPSFHVRGKMFVTFVDDHHADGRLAIWCHCSFERQRALVAAHPDRYFVPPYVGVRGWIGARLDQSTTDWLEIAILVEEGWLAVAPPKLVRGDGPPPVPAPRAPPRPTTDAKVAREGLARLTKICLALPHAICEQTGRHATFLIGKKLFVYFLDNHHGDSMVLACVRGAQSENDRLVKKDPKRYCSPAYIGKRGWLGIRLETGRPDWKELAERVAASYASVAPKRAKKGEEKSEKKPRAAPAAKKRVAAPSRRRRA